MSKIVVVIPNWNGAEDLPRCIDSLYAQTVPFHLIVVDNGSVDNSVNLITKRYPDAEIIRHRKNKGYAGGVNPGFRRAIELGYDYVAPFNNDAVADKHWLEHLARYLDKHPHVGIAAAKVLDIDGKHLDSAGEQYSVWGLPFARGRDELAAGAYDKLAETLGASGSSSLYRVMMLKQIGIFDEDFFAYYEDVDISLRAQLAGWKVAYVPDATVYHATSTTGRKIKGFFTYQTIKNYPWLLVKDMPASIFWHVAPRLALAELLFIGRAIERGHTWWAIKAVVVSIWFMPKKVIERYHIQSSRTVEPSYIWGMMTHDLPPGATGLLRLRNFWQRRVRYTKD